MRLSTDGFAARDNPSICSQIGIGPLAPGFGPQGLMLTVPPSGPLTIPQLTLPPPPPPPPPPPQQQGREPGPEPIFQGQQTLNFDQLFQPQPTELGQLITKFVRQPDFIKLPELKPQPDRRLPNIDDFSRQFRQTETTDESVRRFRPFTETEQAHGGDSDRVREDIQRGRLPHLTGVDPPQLPDLDALRATGEAAIETKPCLACQMTDAERAKLIGDMPPDAVEVSFLCPSADEAENLARGVDHKCVPV